ncbi:MAG: alpha/beta hydrolase [Myxococcota bacterium]
MNTAEAVALAQRLWASLPERKLEARGVLNGLFGDHLETAGSPLAIEMTLCRGDRTPLSHPPEAPVGTGPSACVLVHGLMGTDHAWSFARGDDTAEFGEALADARQATPIYARYNTGRHISVNGRELAERLEALVQAWPGLQQLSIVAHSMGGLVTRSAVHYGMEAGHTWVGMLSRVFLLGAPSHGAPLEQLVHVAAFTLEAVWNPWTKIIGKLLNLRSAGIKDLRHGFVLDEDWRNRDVDELALRKPRPASMPDHVRWFIAAGTVGQPKGKWGWLIGDGLVRSPSAQGKGFGTLEPGLLPNAKHRVFDQTSHIALMNDPAVLEQIVQWWADDEAGPS